MEKNKYIVTDSHVYFHGSFLSNWYPCPIEYEGKNFHCSEQLYMWFKAKFFRDEETADKIIKCTHAREAKDLGRQVNGFDKERWDERSFGYMLYCVYIKFKQNFELRDELLKLGEGRKFVEGSPVDTIWGVGIDYRDMKIRDEKNWRGKNKLGQCLDYAYNELKNTKDRIELI